MLVVMVDFRYNSRCREGQEERRSCRSHIAHEELCSNCIAQVNEPKAGENSIIPID